MAVVSGSWTWLWFVCFATVFVFARVFVCVDVVRVCVVVRVSVFLCEFLWVGVCVCRWLVGWLVGGFVGGGVELVGWRHPEY